MGFNRHTHPPPPPNFKDCIKCKGKRYKKREKYMKVRDKGGGVPTNIFRGVESSLEELRFFLFGGGG